MPGAPAEIGSGKPAVLYFFQADCPTCGMMAPYLNRLARALPAGLASLVAVSQDDSGPTAEFVRQTGLEFPVSVDGGLRLSRLYDPVAVPALFRLDGRGQVVEQHIGFEKDALNRVAANLCRLFGLAPVRIAEEFDGQPSFKPGCSSRHREPIMEAAQVAGEWSGLLAGTAPRATRIKLDDDTDLFDYCLEAGFTSALPVAPSTARRVDRMLAETLLPPDEVIARIPPNYAPATVEKIAANAAMAGCPPAMMRILIPLVRACCEEKFNLHGVQATTHFVTPLILVNGPARLEMDFCSGSNVFSGGARANATLGRALQLILINLGGARPGEIDMSTLGNPGKISYCIAENEEQSPWEPFHVERGFSVDQSAVTVYAADSPRGFSEHNARRGADVLRVVSHQLAALWNYRVCRVPAVLIALCPEHALTIARDGFSKAAAREFLFEHSGVPLRLYAEGDGEGVAERSSYQETVIDGEPCYRKFASPQAIRIIVTGGTAGKFSAVIGSWGVNLRTEMVTYPVN